MLFLLQLARCLVALPMLLLALLTTVHSLLSFGAALERVALLTSRDSAPGTHIHRRSMLIDDIEANTSLTITWVAGVF